MRLPSLVLIVGMLALTACNGAKKPSDANFTVAINAYLSRHGRACTVIGRQFPIDVPWSEQEERYRDRPQAGRSGAGRPRTSY